MQVLIYALIGAFMNSFIRGGFIKKWFPSFRGSKILNATGFGIAAYYALDSVPFALAFAVGMMAGQAPALFHEDTDKYKAFKDWPRWALVVAERAMVWVLPFVLISLFLNRDTAHYWLVLIPVMPIFYSLDWTNWNYRWAASEASFGACMWVVLVLL